MTSTRLWIGAVCGLALGVFAGHRWWPHAGAGLATDADDHKGPVAEAPATPGEVQLTADAMTRLGVHTAPVQAAQTTPTLRVPGRVEADPAAWATVRAPMAGRLVAAAKPATALRLGARVGAGSALWTLTPRLSGAELADLQQRRAEAEAARVTASSALTNARLDHERQVKLHENGNTASQHAVEAAEAEVAAATAKFAAAEQTLVALDAMLGDGPPSITIAAPCEGLLVELLARGGEDVDAGAVLARIGDPAHLCVRAQVPARADVDALLVHATVELPFADHRTVGAGAQGWVGATAGGDRELLLALEQPPAELRPGLPVVVHLPRAGGAVDGLAVPETAVVRRGDGAWVWVRDVKVGEVTVFRRLAVGFAAPLDGASGPGWLVCVREGGLTAGAELVVEGAGALLSVERERTIDAEEGG